MPESQRCGTLIRLAVEVMLPAVTTGLGEEVTDFAPAILGRWREWLGERPADEGQAAVAALAALPTEQARAEGSAAVEGLPAEVQARVLGHLAALPGIAARVLAEAVTAPPISPCGDGSDGRPPPEGTPFTPPCQLAGTPYYLEELLGRGGFGAVYRATSASLQHLPLAIKFCLDPEGLTVLRRERDVLERLTRGGKHPSRVVRLYGYDLEHPTPYLVYEYVGGGNLLDHLTRCRREEGRALDAGEVLEVVHSLAEALASAHRQGLVHRDLKPTNVLVDERGQLKLADFGLGAVAVFAATTGRPSSAVSSLRGAGTPLYISPEQRRGEAADPRHDLYSLGVVWFQLLLGDLSRELTPGWTRELDVAHAPPAQIELVGRCVGPLSERPRDAGVLLELLTRPDDHALPLTRPPPVPEEEHPCLWLAARFDKLGRHLKEAGGAPWSPRARLHLLAISAVGSPLLVVLLTVAVAAGGGNLDALIKPLEEWPTSYLFVSLLGILFVAAPIALWGQMRSRDDHRERARAVRCELAEWPGLVEGLGDRVLNSPPLLPAHAAALFSLDTPPTTASQWRRLLGRVLMMQLAEERALRPRPGWWWGLGCWAAFAFAPAAVVVSLWLVGRWPREGRWMSAGMLLSFMPVALGGMVLYLKLSDRWLRWRHRRGLGDPARRLAEWFPEEVRAWGGLDALGDAAAIRGLVARWGAPVERPAAGSPPRSRPG